jgi:hypothetical protein
MLRTIPQDRQKIERAIENVMRQSQGKQFVFVHGSDFYRELHFSKLQRTNFAEEVSDALTGTVFCIKHGVWVYTEFGDGLYVFCRIHTKTGYRGTFIDNLVEKGIAVDLTKTLIDASEPEDEDEEEDEDTDEKPASSKIKGYRKTARPLIDNDESGW